MYGIRDAARGWQGCLGSHLVQLGFRQGVAPTCVFTQDEWDLAAVVHGDDYVTSGPPEGLAQLQKALEEKLELSKTVHIGTHPGAVAEGKVLNRVIRRTDAGWELEADMRHGEMMVTQLGS